MILTCIFCLFSFLSSLVSLFAEDYQKLLVKDLYYIRAVLEENHPGYFDDMNPQFKKWLQEGFIQSCALADQIKDREAYFSALRLYINGFKDAHVGLAVNFEPKKVCNDFSFYFNGEDYIVSSSPNSSIPVGARLAYINGISPREFLRENLFKFFGNLDLTSSFYKSAIRLSTWMENPFADRPRSFSFEINNQLYEHHIAWFTKENVMPCSGNQESFSMEKIAHDTVWVRLATFFPSEDERPLLKMLIDTLPSYRNHDIVFDVRANTGGSSSWGELIIDQLCGKDFYNQHFKHSSVDWRASKGNIEGFKKLLPIIEKNFGQKSETMDRVYRIIEGLEVAVAYGRVYFHETSRSLESIDQKKLPNLFRGRVFVVIDEWCASACLDFIDGLKQCMDNIYLIGHPTNADTLYMEVLSVELPSGKATLMFPTKILRDRMRGNNEFYHPDTVWQGQMNDIKELQEYVLKNKNNFPSGKR